MIAARPREHPCRVSQRTSNKPTTMNRTRRTNHDSIDSISDIAVATSTLAADDDNEFVVVVLVSVVLVVICQY